MVSGRSKSLRAARVIGVGVDWITATAPPDWPDARLLEEGDRLLALMECQGIEPKERLAHGYAIRQAGPVSCGIGDQGALVTVSGGAAAGAWHRLVPVARRVTRLDVQVTCRPAPPDPYLMHDHLRECQEWRKRRRAKPNLKWWGEGDQYRTLYIGAQTSESMARIYDKGAESGEEEYADAWRYEVQTRTPLAGRLASVLWALPEREAAVGMYVSEYFRRRGMYPRFDATGTLPRVASGKPRGDNERRLKYLYDVIRPMILGLVDEGRGAEAWENVGLPEHLAAQADEWGRLKQWQEPVKGLEGPAERAHP